MFGPTESPWCMLEPGADAPRPRRWHSPARIMHDELSQFDVECVETADRLVLPLMPHAHRILGN